MYLPCTKAHGARGTVDRGGNGGVGSAPSQATTKIYTRWLSQRESFTAFLGKTDN